MTPTLETCTLAPGAVSRGYNSTAKFITVKACSLPVTLAINGGQSQTIAAGAVITLGGSGVATNQFQFSNPQLASVTISFWLAHAPVDFSANDNSASIAPTTFQGNLGVANGAGAQGGLPASTVAATGIAYLQITNGMNLVIPATLNGHKRQSITFSVDPAAAYSAILSDSNGSHALPMTKGQQLVLDTGDVLSISGAGGTVGVCISQTFLAS